MNTTNTTVLTQVEDVSRDAQRRYRRGWTPVPNRLYNVTGGLRGAKVYVVWHIAERSLDQRYRHADGVPMRPHTIARKYDLTLRAVRDALRELIDDEIVAIPQAATSRRAARYRLGDWIIEQVKDDSGKDKRLRFIDGFTKFPNGAWQWLPRVSPTGWRLLTALVRMKEPAAMRDSVAFAYNATVMRTAGFRSQTTLRQAVWELREIGLLRLTHRYQTGSVTERASGGDELEEDDRWLASMWDFGAVFLPPSADGNASLEVRDCVRPMTLLRLKTPHIQYLTHKEPLPTTKEAPSNEEALSSVRTAATRVLSEDPDGSESPATPGRSQTSYTSLTPGECRAFLLGDDNPFWAMVSEENGVGRRQDGQDNIKVYCLRCKGDDFSFYTGPDDDPAVGRIAGAGHCFHCGWKAHLTEYIAEWDGPGVETHRWIVAHIRRLGASYPPAGDRLPLGERAPSAGVRAAEALATLRRLPEDEGERRVLESLIRSEALETTLRGVLVRFDLAWLGRYSVPEGDTTDAILRRLHAGGWVRFYRVYKHDRQPQKRLDRLPAKLSENAHHIVIAWEKINA